MGLNGGLRLKVSPLKMDFLAAQNHLPLSARVLTPSGFTPSSAKGICGGGGSTLNHTTPRDAVPLYSQDKITPAETSVQQAELGSTLVEGGGNYDSKFLEKAGAVLLSGSHTGRVTMACALTDSQSVRTEELSETECDELNCTQDAGYGE